MTKCPNCGGNVMSDGQCLQCCRTFPVTIQQRTLPNFWQRRIQQCRDRREEKRK